MNNPSMLSAINKLRFLLSKEEKYKLLSIAIFALVTSVLEVITASVIVVFARIINNPDFAQQYFSGFAFIANMSPSKVVFTLAILVGLVYLIKNIVAALEVTHQNFVIQRMSYNFKNKSLYRYADSDYSIILTRNSSSGLNLVTSDVEMVFSIGMVALASILSESTVFICLLSVIIYLNPSLAALVFVLAAAIGLLLIKVVFPLFYVWGEKLQEAAIYGHQHLLQFFHGFKEIVLLGKQKEFVDEFKQYSWRKTRILALQASMNALPRILLEVLFVGLFVATIAFLCFKHESPMGMIGTLGGYLYAGFRLMPGLNRIINQLNNFKSTIPYIERIHDEFQNVIAKHAYVSAPDLTFNNRLVIKDLSYSYPNTEKNSLIDINIEILKGEIVGIVGETGSGKSTFVDVILGLLQPKSGYIYVDGKYPVNSQQWQQKIGYVPQSIYLTDNTIAANIAFGVKEIDMHRLEQAIDAAQLRKFVNQLPNGLATLVGERGVRISGGERQRIAIARALYHEPEILIFDEATSSLDGDTEARLMETIHEVSKNRTVIMIAHRLTTLKNCHKILTMQNGRIEKITSYSELNKAYQ